jgi:rare lipoprotein A
MPFARTWPKSQLTVVASAIVLAAAALPASAGPRAPIKYAYEGTTSAPTVSRTAAPVSSADKATQRIEFRYPGSTGGAGRIEMASATVPQAASPAAEATFTEAPQFAPSTPIFDARTTAAVIGTAGKVPVVEATSLQPLAVVPKAAAAIAAPSGAVFETGVAIVYGDEFDGLPTANGEIFDQSALTAAHPTLPLPSVVQVSNPANGKDVFVRVNDRGPFEDGASLQVSREVARVLGFEGAGKAELTVRLVDEKAASTVAKPREENGPKLITASYQAPQPAKVAPADELLGGDELAGGTSWTAPKRAEVKWPEPPAEWGVAPETKPAVQKVSASVGGTHFVQLASFSDIGNAETLYRGLKADLPVEIVPARVNGTDYFRVRVGPFASRESAQQLRDRLNAEGKGDGRVVTAE